MRSKSYSRRPPAKANDRRREPKRGPLSSGSPQLPGKERWVAGVHAVREALKVRPTSVSHLWLREDWQHRQDLREMVEAARNFKGALRAVPESVLDRICQSHQGAIASVSENPEWQPSDLKDGEKAVVMVLDQITDSHNLGAILRTAWLMGVKAVYVPEMRSNHLSPSASKVASGGAEHVPLIVESHLPGLFKELKELGFWVYGLAGEADLELWKCEFPERVVWVVGAEDKGIRSSVASCCDELVAIFQGDSEASYNASVAAGMALAETLRQLKSP